MSVNGSPLLPIVCRSRICAAFVVTNLQEIAQKLYNSRQADRSKSED
jgi:hypothetical protein